MDTPETPRHCEMCELEAAGLSADSCLAAIAGDAERAGWAVHGVPAHDRGPSWACSVGLWHSFRAPELAVFGLPLDTMAGIINALGGHVAAGIRFEAGDRLDGVCPCSLQLCPVDPSWRLTSMFAISNAVYGLIRPPCFQVAWPDRDGRFPWEPGFEPALAGCQPLLWLPRDDSPPGRWITLDEDQPG